MFAIFLLSKGFIITPSPCHGRRYTYFHQGHMMRLNNPAAALPDLLGVDVVVGEEHQQPVHVKPHGAGQEVGARELLCRCSSGACRCTSCSAGAPGALQMHQLLCRCSAAAPAALQMLCSCSAGALQLHQLLCKGGGHRWVLVPAPGRRDIRVLSLIHI